MIKRLILTLAMVLGSSMLLPAGAALAACNPSIYNACMQTTLYSDRSVLACEDWSGTSADPGCKSNSRTQRVYPGNWSTFYDTDGFYLPSDCNATVHYSLPGSLEKQTTWWTSTGWRKISNGYNWYIDLSCS